MVVLAAALKSIPVEVLEAARVDGAGEWELFRRVMLPMLSLPISIVTIWLFINVIKLFDIIYVMTGGGPGTSSRVIAFTMFEETFANGRPGYGAAVAVVILIFVSDPSKQPMTVRIPYLLSTYGQEYHLLSAAAFVLMILPLIVFFSLQRYFVQGLLAGSVKT
jgi:ABC-type glycerol-3-phosphate transport system permease component